MDIPITFTLGQLATGFLAVCSGIAVIGVAVGWIIKLVRVAKKPNADQNERLDMIDEKLVEFDGYLRRDKQRIDVIEEGNRITQRAILALLSHGIDGNDVESMRKAKAELTEYLISR